MRKESWDIAADVEVQPFVFLVYSDLLGALEIYFHDSLLEWHICHFQFTLRAFAYVCASVRVCWRVGVPAEQFPLMRKARRRYLGDVMKDLEGNIVGSFQRELIINVYSLKVFRSSAGRSMCQCVRTCVCMYVCVYVCKYKG